MAAGIGEASAILSVAQIGISLSKTLITYIEEVKDAPSHIQRIGNEILTTSERLKDIGELVNQNPHTKVFSEEGINSAVRCSSECQEIIRDVKSVLCKGGWKAYPRDSEKDEVDPSLLSTFRWPFAKLKLEVPRAELHRIKLDLSLLFSAAMVLGASTKVEKQRLAQDIPELHKARAWATKRVEKAKEMAQNRPRTSRARDTPFSDDEPEMLEDFLVFKEKIYHDAEEERIKARARTIQAEDDARRRKEEDAKREVERKAVEEYKKNQQEEEKRAAGKRDKFRKELERLGLESTQIQVVMESSNLDFQAASGTALSPEVRPSLSRRESSIERVVMVEENDKPFAASRWARFRLPRWRSKKYTRDSLLEPSLNSSLSESTTDPYSWFEIEVWVIDVCTNQNTKILASADWMDAKMKMSRKDLEVAWIHFAKLKPYCRNRILEFLNHRRDEEPGWTLCHFEIPQKWSPARLFTVRRDEQIIQLTLSRPSLNDQDSDLPSVRPKLEGLSVGFIERGGGLGEESGTKGEAKSTHDNVLAMNTLDLRNKIAGLEKKKNGLGPQDYERLADLNDMIDYLRDQLKSDAKTTSIYEKRPTEPGKSDSSRAPVTRHEEPSSNSIRRELIVEKNPNGPDKYYYELNLPPSPRPPRVHGAEENSIARHRPREELEIIERNSSPGQLDSEGQHVVRNNSRYGPRERQDYYEEEIFVRSRDQDRSPPRHWQERSRSRSRPSRQDSFGPRGGPIVRRDQSWERSRPRDQTSQPSKQVSEEIYDEYPRQRVGHDRTRSRQSTVEEDIIIRRGEREREMPRERPRGKIIEFERDDYTRRPRERPREEVIEYERDDYTRRPEDQIVIRRNERLPFPEPEPEPEPAPVRDRYEDDRLSPDYGAIVIRRDQRSQSRPREKYSRQRTVDRYEDEYDERHVVEAPGQSQALVLRAGASSLPYDYVRERVFNGGIRVRGDDHVGNASDDSPGFSDDRRPRRRSLSRRSVPPEPAVSPYIRRPSRPASSRRGSYRDRSWAPSLRRRLSETWHQFDSSEDEESRYPPIKRVDNENNGPETELSDAEVIAQILKQLTTIQDSDMPGTGLPAPPTRTRSEVGPSALKSTSYPSSGPERQRSFPVSGRKAHFEQEIGPPQPDQDAQSGATKEGSKPADEEPFMDRISEEPDAMTEDNEIPHHQRVVYFPERPIPLHTNQRTPFPHPPDLAPHTREASPRPRSPTSTLDNPRSTSANGPIIVEHHGYSLASHGEEAPDHAAREVGHEEVEDIRTISRNPTVYEEVD